MVAEAVEDRKSQLQPKRAESDGAGLRRSSSAAPHEDRRIYRDQEMPWSLQKEPRSGGRKC